MAAGKQASKDITITYDDAPGGTGRNVTNHILTMSGVKIDNIQQPSEAFGDAWGEMLASGFRRVPPITFTGFFDNTATTGPHIVFKVVDGDADPQGNTRTLVIVFGDSQTFTVETRLASYEVLGKNAALTEFAAVVNPTGSAAWT